MSNIDRRAQHYTENTKAQQTHKLLCAGTKGFKRGLKRKAIERHFNARKVHP